MAPIVAYMARSGAGTDACLQRSVIPLPVHYYSPVPDIEDLAERNIWSRRSRLGGIDMKVNSQLSLLRQLGHDYGNECFWSHEPTENQFEFYTNTHNFSYGCAAVTHAMLRSTKPKHVIEIGSGHSSKVIAAALSFNREEKGREQTDYTVIDPFPRTPVANKLPGLTKLMRKRVELTELDIFEHLEANDVLFIDSGHTVRTGGDVNFLILEVLPILAPGVIVHFHDVPLPYEYPQVYFTNSRFRVFWTEAYLLQAFLALNDYFEVLLAMSYLMTEYLEQFKQSFPNYRPGLHTLSSSSFWIRRQPDRSLEASSLDGDTEES